MSIGAPIASGLNNKCFELWETNVIFKNSYPTPARMKVAIQKLAMFSYCTFLFH